MGVPWKQQGNDGELTEMQRFYLEAMGRWFDARGRYPTLRELARDAGVTYGAVGNVLTRLRGKGFVARGPKGRLVLTEKGVLARYPF